LALFTEQWLKPFCQYPTVLSPRPTPKGAFFMPAKYPYKSPEQFKRCAEFQSKADKAAKNIAHAANKPRAVNQFLKLLYLSI